MRKLRLQALFLITGVVLTWGVQAQTIYRCGNSYSQVPCPGAQPMNLNDSRHPEQKLQTDAAIQNVALIAKTMEQERLAEEQRLLAGNRPITSSAPDKSEPSANGLTTLTPKRAQPKHKKPETFIAETPGSEKLVMRKKKSKKKAKKPA